MVIVQVCVGSSCHLKGAPEIVEMMQREVAERGLEDEVILTGSFCTGKCNRIGVTIAVDDDVYTGVTPATFREFWNDRVLTALEKSRGN